MSSDKSPLERAFTRTTDFQQERWEIFWVSLALIAPSPGLRSRNPPFTLLLDWQDGVSKGDNVVVTVERRIRFVSANSYAEIAELSDVLFS